TNIQRESVSSETTVPSSVVAKRVIYYIGGAILSLLALRFILALLGAAEGNGFVDFIYGLSAVFVAPFFGIFGEPTYGANQLETSTLVAMIVYALLTVGIAKLLTLGSNRQEV
ncbi:MAG TPA: YggT family protein, partial [Candidatus Nitrosotenuis sp.]|nr:YggT family protein [Candidatus Nitrosotenuis sp.]